MHSAQVACRQAVSKLWQIRGVLVALPSVGRTLLSTLLINTPTYTLVMPCFATQFSTHLTLLFNPLFTYLYPTSTTPTNTTTRLLNFKLLSC
jgi:hypothetical protein